LSQLDIKSFREATHTHDLTTPLDFALDTDMTNSDMSLLDFEPIPHHHSSAAAAEIVSAMNSQSDCGNPPFLSNMTTGNTLARAASCLWESTLKDWRGDGNGGGGPNSASLATSYSCPTLTTSQKKRLCPESFEINCGSWNYAPEVCSDTLSDIVPYRSSPATTLTPPPPPPSSTTTTNTDSNKRLKFCKPLKVYNYFYRDERDNIVHGMKQHGDPLPPPVNDFSQAKFEQLLHQRWYVLDMRLTVYTPSCRATCILTLFSRLLRYVDPIKERRLHRKMHGKIEFST
jgi:hypothetical protein